MQVEYLEGQLIGSFNIRPYESPGKKNLQI